MIASSKKTAKMLKTGPLVFFSPAINSKARSERVFSILNCRTCSKRHLNTISPCISLIPFIYLNRPVLSSAWYCVTGSGPLIPFSSFSLRAFMSPFINNSSCLAVHSFWKSLSKPYWSFHHYAFANNQSIYFCCFYRSFPSAWHVLDRWKTSLHDKVRRGITWGECTSSKLSNFMRISVVFFKWWTPDQKRRDKEKVFL